MTKVGAELVKLLLCSGDHAGDLSTLVDQSRHDVTFRHIHPRSRNDRGDYPLQADMMSAARLVCLRHDTGVTRRGSSETLVFERPKPPLTGSPDHWHGL